MSAFTSGPWSYWPTCCGDGRITTEKGQHICTPFGEANANLIAAAPELYEALNLLFALIDEGRLVRDTSHDHEPGWAFKQLDIVRGLQAAQTALAKADGRPA